MFWWVRHSTRPDLPSHAPANLQRRPSLLSWSSRQAASQRPSVNGRQWRHSRCVSGLCVGIRRTPEHRLRRGCPEMKSAADASVRVDPAAAPLHRQLPPGLLRRASRRERDLYGGGAQRTVSELLPALCGEPVLLFRREGCDGVGALRPLRLQWTTLAR